MQIQPVGYPGQRVAIDIMGPISSSRYGNKYILVVIDYFSKYAEATPMRNQEAVTVAKKFAATLVFCVMDYPNHCTATAGLNSKAECFKN